MSKKMEYTFVWSDYQSLLTLEMNLEAARILRDNIWNQIDTIVEVAKDNVIRCFHSTEDIHQDVKRGEVFLDDAYFQNFQQDVENERRISWEFFSELRQVDFQNISDEKLRVLLKKNILQWEKQITLFRASQADPQEALFREFQKYVSSDDVLQYLRSPVPDLT